MRRSIRRLFREPLVHFFLLGSLLLVAHGAFAKKPERTIEVTAKVTSALRADHERRTGKPPTNDELRALVDQWIDDEVRVREAQSLGLDRGDVIVRRRLAQKADFLFEGDVEEPEPTDAELLAYRDAHATQFARSPRITMTHVFFSSQIHGGDTARLAAEAATKLAAGADAATLGDPFLRGSSFHDRTEAELASIVGAEAAHVASTVDVDRWSAPVTSAAGLHLIRVTERHDDAGIDPSLRGELRAAWLDERREQARKAAVTERRRAYDVRIDDGALPGADR